MLIAAPTAIHSAANNSGRITDYAGRVDTGDE
jgi:hypothetical protein